MSTRFTTAISLTHRRNLLLWNNCRGLKNESDKAHVALEDLIRAAGVTNHRQFNTAFKDMIELLEIKPSIEAMVLCHHPELIERHFPGIRELGIVKEVQWWDMQAARMIQAKTSPFKNTGETQFSKEHMKLSEQIEITERSLMAGYY